MRKRAVKDFEKIKSDVYNALKIGKQNAISRIELSSITGYRDRRIREAIESLRHTMVILNLDQGDGYYIPESNAQGRHEAALWIYKQNTRMRSMKAATKGAERFVSAIRKSIPGQLRMEILENGKITAGEGEARREGAG